MYCAGEENGICGGGDLKVVRMARMAQIGSLRSKLKENLIGKLEGPKGLEIDGSHLKVRNRVLLASLVEEIQQIGTNYTKYLLFYSFNRIFAPKNNWV